MVVFSITDTAFHGHPEPLRCPPGPHAPVARLLLLLERPARARALGHALDAVPAATRDRRALKERRLVTRAVPATSRARSRAATPPARARAERAARRRAAARSASACSSTSSTGPSTRSASHRGGGRRLRRCRRDHGRRVRRGRRRRPAQPRRGRGGGDRRDRRTIQLVGFDSGAGLPPRSTTATTPRSGARGDFAMPDAGRARADARLVLGPVAETLPGFMTRPLGDPPDRLRELRPRPLQLDP